MNKRYSDFNVAHNRANKVIFVYLEKQVMNRI